VPFTDRPSLQRTDSVVIRIPSDVSASTSGDLDAAELPDLSNLTEEEVNRWLAAYRIQCAYRSWMVRKTPFDEWWAKEMATPQRVEVGLYDAELAGLNATLADIQAETNRIMGAFQVFNDRNQPTVEELDALQAELNLSQGFYTRAVDVSGNRGVRPGVPADPADRAYA
jgi:hypothetical protein